MKEEHINQYNALCKEFFGENGYSECRDFEIEKQERIDRVGFCALEYLDHEVEELHKIYNVNLCSAEYIEIYKHVYKPAIIFVQHTFNTCDQYDIATAFNGLVNKYFHAYFDIHALIRNIEKGEEREFIYYITD